MIRNEQRIEFESGTFRDSKGKGRFDLVHSEIINMIIKFEQDESELHDVWNAWRQMERHDDANDIITLVMTIAHLNGLSKYEILDRYAKRLESSTVKYKEQSWERGLPLWSFESSAKRHFTKHELGWDDEKHIDACIWNLLCMWYTATSILPNKEEKN